MRLFHSPTSPFVRKVLAAADELGLASRIELLPAAQHPILRDAVLVRHNPLGQVPVLIDDRGFELHDSRVICAYLDDVAAPRSLLPAGTARWAARRMESVADGMLDAAIQCRYETVLRPSTLRWDRWCQASEAKLASGVDWLESQSLDAQDFHIGALTAAVALAYMDFRLPELEWRSRAPRLAAWHAGAIQRASMRSTAPTTDREPGARSIED